MTNASRAVNRHINTLFAVILLLSSSLAAADQFYLTVEVNCDASRRMLKIYFRGYWNEAGEQALAIAGNDVVDPRRLMKITQNRNGVYAVDAVSVIKKCAIGKSKYEIDIRPLVAPGFHPEGFCATRVGANVIVKDRGKTLVHEGTDACTESGLVTTNITLVPNIPVSVEKTSSEKFYAE